MSKTKKMFAVLFAMAVLLMSYAVVCLTKKSPLNVQVFMTEIEALASSESGGYSCTVRVVCSYLGGFVECTGQHSCSRGYFSVTCDGNTTSC